MRGRRGGGLNRDQFICFVMFSRVKTLRRDERPLGLHVLPETLKSQQEIERE